MSLLALTMVVGVLSSCGTSIQHAGTLVKTPAATATATVLPKPTSLTVLRFGGVYDSHVAPFQMSTQDITKVQQLYDATVAQPPYSYRGAWCPADMGIGYELTFTSGDTVVRQVLLTGGCPTEKLSNPQGCRDWTPALTAQVAATVGVPVTTLEPAYGLRNTAGPNGPFAPGGPTPPVVVPQSCA